MKVTLDINKIPLQKRAAILVTVSAILYGFLGYFGIKLVTEGFSISNMLFWRFFIATLWISLLSVNKIRKQSSLEISLSSLLLACAIGSLLYAGCEFYFIASLYAGTGLAMVIFFAYPLFVVLFARVIEQHPLKKNTIIALSAIFMGMILLAMGKSAKLSLIGIFCALLSALTYAIYFYGSKYFAKIIPSYLQTILICLGCSIIFLIGALYTHSFALPSTIQTWFYAAGLGIVATAVPIQLLLEGLKHIHPNKASLLSAFEPVVTLFVGMALLGEVVSVMQLLGALIIIIGAICVH